MRHLTQNWIITPRISHPRTHLCELEDRKQSSVVQSLVALGKSLNGMEPVQWDHYLMEGNVFGILVPTP